MAKITDLKKARQVKNSAIAIDNIKDIVKIMDLAMRGLEHFKGYKSVQNVVRTMKDEKATLEAHLSQFRKLKENKDD